MLGCMRGSVKVYERVCVRGGVTCMPLCTGPTFVVKASPVFM